MTTSRKLNLPSQVLGFTFTALICILSAGCDPYITRQINNISKHYKGDSIYVAGPLIETRLQTTKDSFTGDSESFEPAERLTKKALHQLFDGRLKVEYDQTDPINSWRTKIAVDSLLDKFSKAQYLSCSVNSNLQFQTKASLILIPYLIWTRTTRDYDDGTCGHDSGRNYFSDQHCYWTKASAYLLLIDKKTKVVLYFKSSNWFFLDILLPFDKRVTKSFKRCSQPLLRKLG